MPDRMSQKDRKKTMKAIKSISIMENSVTKALWAKGLRFRKNVRDLLGKPDIVIKKYKIVIFIDSCFWHGCTVHYRIPKTNVEYWNPKILKNMKRDIKVSDYYLNNSWSILRVWEHQLKDDFEKTIEDIALFITTAKERVHKHNQE